MKFRAKIRKGGADEYTKIIEAPSRFAVYEQVQKEGGFVVELTEGDGRLRLPSWLYYSIGTGIKRTEIIRLAKNLSAMLGAGLALSRALSVIERQSSNKHLKTVVTDISESIKKGTSFHAALGKYPKVFPALFVAMVRAGEESGSLSDSLTIIGVQMERSEELIRKVKGAMIYPSIVISAVLIVAVLMLIFVVPTLTKTFTQLGVQVPLATRVIVAISNFMAENVMVVFLGLVSLIIGGIAFVRSKEGSAIVLSTSLYIPIIGELVRETFAARASRTISSLLASGVPVLDALAITKEVVHAGAFAKVVSEAEERVKKGEPLSSAFVEHSKLYPILMGDMLSVGEETGKVAEMLRQVAEFYEADVAERTKDLSTIIEPILMLVIGSFVGIFAVSMIAPIYSLSSAF
ncbi:MAG: type II secretion system F family protein [bacterium]|nr:type II secretion system F family protein [bacterium]MDO8742259.1 type II secretion system F family protein [bacterium]